MSLRLPRQKRLRASRRAIKNAPGKVQSEPMASKKETKIGAHDAEEGKENVIHSHASARQQKRDERDAK